MYSVLVGKPLGKRTLGRPRLRCVDNIRMNLRYLGCGYMGWIGLSQDRYICRTLVSAVMNFAFREMQGISLLAANRLASQVGLWSK